MLKQILLFIRFTSPALFTAVFYFFPISFPFLSPNDWFSTTSAALLGKILFVASMHRLYNKEAEEKLRRLVHALYGTVLFLDKIEFLVFVVLDGTRLFVDNRLDVYLSKEGVCLFGH